jgi:hypothetical protein
MKEGFVTGKKKNNLNFENSYQYSDTFLIVVDTILIYTFSDLVFFLACISVF